MMQEANSILLNNYDAKENVSPEFRLSRIESYQNSNKYFSKEIETDHIELTDHRLDCVYKALPISQNTEKLMCSSYEIIDNLSKTKSNILLEKNQESEIECCPSNQVITQFKNEILGMNRKSSIPYDDKVDNKWFTPDNKTEFDQQILKTRDENHHERRKPSLKTDLSMISSDIIQINSRQSTPIRYSKMTEEEAAYVFEYRKKELLDSLKRVNTEKKLLNKNKINVTPTNQNNLRLSLHKPTSVLNSDGKLNMNNFIIFSDNAKNPIFRDTMRRNSSKTPSKSPLSKNDSCNKFDCSSQKYQNFHTFNSQSPEKFPPPSTSNTERPDNLQKRDESPKPINLNFQSKPKNSRKTENDMFSTHIVPILSNNQKVPIKISLTKTNSEIKKFHGVLPKKIEPKSPSCSPIRQKNQKENFGEVQGGVKQNPKSMLKYQELSNHQISRLEREIKNENLKESYPSASPKKPMKDNYSPNRRLSQNICMDKIKTNNRSSGISIRELNKKTEYEIRRYDDDNPIESKTLLRIPFIPKLLLNKKKENDLQILNTKSKNHSKEFNYDYENGFTDLNISSNEENVLAKHKKLLREFEQKEKAHCIISEQKLMKSSKSKPELRLDLTTIMKNSIGKINLKENHHIKDYSPLFYQKKNDQAISKAEIKVEELNPTSLFNNLNVISTNFPNIDEFETPKMCDSKNFENKKKLIMQNNCSASGLESIKNKICEGIMTQNSNALHKNNTHELINKTALQNNEILNNKESNINQMDVAKSTRENVCLKTGDELQAHISKSYALLENLQNLLKVQKKNTDLFSNIETDTPNLNSNINQIGDKQKLLNLYIQDYKNLTLFHEEKDLFSGYGRLSHIYPEDDHSPILNYKINKNNKIANLKCQKRLDFKLGFIITLRPLPSLFTSFLLFFKLSEYRKIMILFKHEFVSKY